MAGVASTFPVAGLLTIIILLPQTEYRIIFLGSMASPLGPSQGAIE